MGFRECTILLLKRSNMFESKNVECCVQGELISKGGFTGNLGNPSRSATDIWVFFINQRALLYFITETFGQDVNIYHQLVPNLKSIHQLFCT